MPVLISTQLNTQEEPFAHVWSSFFFFPFCVGTFLVLCLTTPGAIDSQHSTSISLAQDSFFLHLSFPSVCCNWYTLPTDSVRAHFNNFLLLRDRCSAPSIVRYLQTLISYIQSSIFFSLILDSGVSQVPITPSCI